ncbi:hypothetical protein BAE44_0014671 [Dichanthelium oligosanthes]|uniref:Uncharacterized protein n=1 Tax=Dichanthelium oligosanthes TaxID=888268 RepID=A0A1E5VGT1_9POAL|nr:hypothetical protein BAE44_0014671 [Dichanthelium oligosanthes]
MGLPLEQWRGGEADGGKEKASSAGCRTPGNGQAGRAAAANDCPAAPRKRRAPAGGAVAQQQQRRRDYYTGDDVEAFFAANNL